jgi:hypothetical protein
MLSYTGGGAVKDAVLPTNAVDGLYKARRKRRYGPKSKMGCFTCKQVDISHLIYPLLTSPRIRRVKCDETRPGCLRCKAFGTKCDGYPEDTISENLPLKLATLAPLFNRHLGSKQLTGMISPTPSLDLNLDEIEMKYFQSFVEDRFNRPRSLSGEWLNVVLQECHATASTRHATGKSGLLKFHQ